MADDFVGYDKSIMSAPPEHAAIITPDDSTDLTHATRAIFVGATGGALKVTMVGGEVLVWPDLPAKSVIPMRVKRVWLTSQVATPIVALW